jgi:hypothetical protein
MNQSQPHAASTSFLSGLLRTVNELCTQLETVQAESLRLVTTELVELNPDVTLLLVCPPAERVCRMSCGPNEDTDKPVAVYLPVSMFEANSLDAYNPRFIREYVKVSIKLEIEHLASSQYQREAFSKEEVCNSKRFVTSVNKYQKRLEEIWKESRWIVKHISELRDKDRQANTLPVVSLVNWSRKGTELRLD